MPGSTVTSTLNEAPAGIASVGWAPSVVQPQPPFIDEIVTGASLAFVIVSIADFG